jgi:hypothetical protein
MSNPDDIWIGRHGGIAHPNSPLGSGGPGRFRQPGCLGKDIGECAHPLSPSTRNAVPDSLELVDDDEILYAQIEQAGRAKLKQGGKGQKREVVNTKKLPPANAPTNKLPPETKPFKRKLKYTSADIFVELLADGSSNDASVQGWTTVQFPAYEFPGYEYDQSTRKITKFKGVFKFNGAITIQTIYGPNASANQLSLYGRGTTEKDKQDGNVSLGFHESRHQRDYIEYLASKPLPAFSLITGMTITQYDAAKAKFEQLYKTYEIRMHQQSETQTDEVGYTRLRCYAEKVCKK